MNSKIYTSLQFMQQKHSRFELYRIGVSKNTFKTIFKRIWYIACNFRTSCLELQNNPLKARNTRKNYNFLYLLYHYHRSEFKKNLNYTSIPLKKKLLCQKLIHRDLHPHPRQQQNRLNSRTPRRKNETRFIIHHKTIVQSPGP